MNSSFRVISITAKDKECLRSELLRQQSVFSISANPKLGVILASLGVQQEVGTINDQLSRYLFNASTEKQIPTECLRSELIEYNGHVGVRIWAEGIDNFDLRIKGLRILLNPELSLDNDGSVKQLVFFPESIAKIKSLENADLVIVKEWALNTIFGGFDPKKRFYETNSWELVENDALRYTELLENRQIAFVGTHDLAAHMSGLQKEEFAELQALGTKTRKRFAKYFSEMKRASVCSLVLPYAAGVLLDDLAQPGNYGALGRRFAFDAVMDAIDSRKIDPTIPKFLTKFPDSYEQLIRTARDLDPEIVRVKAPLICQNLINELNNLSVTMGQADSDPSLSRSINVGRE